MTAPRGHDRPVRLLADLFADAELRARLLRWALIEAIQRLPRDSVIGGVKDAIIARRGKEAKNIAKVAAARRLLTLGVLRDA
jgi:hypothetical protein